LNQEGEATRDGWRGHWRPLRWSKKAQESSEQTLGRLGGRQPMPVAIDL
jgi:hypothetical protein